MGKRLLKKTNIPPETQSTCNSSFYTPPKTSNK
jgi:hypothetical protein